MEGLTFKRHALILERKRCKNLLIRLAVKGSEVEGLTFKRHALILEKKVQKPIDKISGQGGRE